MLFTDTLADVNGVSRFVCDMGRCARGSGRDLTIVTSTRLNCPDGANIVNLRPRLARPMPGYPNLELVTPPVARAARLIRERRPDIIHISTPGPVGLAGRIAAKRAGGGVPIAGVYHTDFPAYIEHLFGDDALTWLSGAAMRWFYGPFTRIFTRSAQFARSLHHLGFHCRRITRLRPGTNIATFHPRFRDPRIWERLECNPIAVKILYCGRVSIEKNLPLLVRAWRGTQSRLRSDPKAPRAQLVIVGDGPYRAQMERDLAGSGACFLGFRHGPELSAIYASSDFLVFPSVTDTLGQTVMEAQASGIPVVITDRGGPREVVRNGQTGLVLPGHTPRAWIDAIHKLIHDAPRRQAMGAAAHAFMQSHSIHDSFEHWWRTHEQSLTDGRM